MVGGKSTVTFSPPPQLLGNYLATFLYVALIDITVSNTMSVEPHKVAKGPNNGSRDDMRGDKYDEQRYESRDQRAETETTFYSYDIDDLQVSYKRKKELKRMLRRQEGEDPGEAYSKNYKNREQQNRKEWKRRMVTTFAANLELTSRQKERSLHLVMDVLDINSFGHYSTEQVILGVINCVVREDGRMIEDEQQFREMGIDVGFDRSNVVNRFKSLRGLVRERVPSF